MPQMRDAFADHHQGLMAKAKDAVSRLAITRYLNKILAVSDIPDASLNGMQVRALPTVSKVGLAVDACMSTFRKAKKLGCDLLIVHHGLFWKGQSDLMGVRDRRVKYLLRNDISLYAAHLPLDLHPAYGNNIQLADLMGLSKILPFHKYGKYHIGFQGQLSRQLTLDELTDLLDSSLETKCRSIKSRRAKIRRVGIVSGGGSQGIYKCPKEIDCLVTGEAPHHITHISNELGVDLILAGHYNTETLGVKAIGKELARKYGILTAFIDNPV